MFKNYNNKVSSSCWAHRTPGNNKRESKIPCNIKILVISIICATAAAQLLEFSTRMDATDLHKWNI